METRRIHRLLRNQRRIERELFREEVFPEERVTAELVSEVSLKRRILLFSVDD